MPLTIKNYHHLLYSVQTFDSSLSFFQFNILDQNAKTWGNSNQLLVDM